LVINPQVMMKNKTSWATVKRKLNAANEALGREDDEGTARYQVFH
jgi:hypothetical protein